MPESQKPTTSWYSSLAEKLVGPFEPLLTLGIKATFKWITLQGPVALRTTACLSLVACLTIGVLLVRHLSLAENILYQSVGAKVRDLNQPNASLQAVLLSDFNKGFDNFKTTTLVHEGFVDFLKQLRGDLTSADSPLSTPLVLPEGKHPITDLFFTLPGQDIDKAFLFVPATIIRSALPESSSGLYSSVDLAPILPKDALLYKDVTLSERVAKDVCTLNNTVVFQPGGIGEFSAKSEPLQSYLISSTGILRICQSQTSSQQAHYQTRFPASSYFPEREYFRETIKQDRGDVRADIPIGTQFYVREPYIDLGGNGVVFSLCKEVALRRPNDSALCMDFPIQAQPKDVRYSSESPADLAFHTMAGRITSLGGESVRLNCEAEGKTSEYHCTDSEGHPHIDIDGRLKTVSGDISEIFGKVNTVYGANGKMFITIPLAQHGSRSGDLLFAQLDVSPIRVRTLYEASGFAVALLLFLLSVALLIADYGLRLNQQNVAFQEVAAVMQHAEIPYCRIDSDDRFIDVNDAFMKMLEYPAGAAPLAGTDFRQWMAPDSLKEYDSQNAKRVEGRMSEYLVALKKCDPSIQKPDPSQLVNVRISGAPVPTPHDPREAKPQTFGIFKVLSSSNLRPMKQRSAG